MFCVIFMYFVFSISINYYILWRKKSKALYKHTIMLKNTGVFSLFCSKKAILPTQSSIM